MGLKNRIPYTTTNHYWVTLDLLVGVPKFVCWSICGYIYLSDGYLIWDTMNYPLSLDLLPVQYPICRLMNASDFPVWSASSTYGFISPWGTGVPTCNFDYINPIVAK
jgi:hypothetical protein